MTYFLRANIILEKFHNVNRNYHVFLEKPSLKIFGKIRIHFHPLRLQAVPSCFLFPPFLFSVSSTFPVPLAPLHQGLDTLKPFPFWGRKKARMKQDLSCPQTPLRQQHQLPPTLPQQHLLQTSPLQFQSQFTGPGHLAFTTPVA